MKSAEGDEEEEEEFLEGEDCGACARADEATQTQKAATAAADEPRQRTALIPLFTFKESSLLSSLTLPFKEPSPAKA
jgi:hypothetical protein